MTASPERAVRRLLPYLARHRPTLVAGIVHLLLTTVLSVASPWLLRLAVDDLTAAVTVEKLRFYAAAIVGVVVLEGGFRYLMRMVLIGLSRTIERELRHDVFAHLLRLPARYWHTHRVGDVMSRATNDLSAVRMVLGPGIMYTASTAATATCTIALMASLQPGLLLLALLPMLLVSWVMRRYGREVHTRSEAVQAQLAEISSLVQENLSGARVVRAYAQEAHEEARFAAESARYVEKNRALVRVYGALYPAIQLLMGLGAALVLWRGGTLVVEGRLTLGEFVAFGSYLAMLQWPMIAVGWVLNLFERGDAAMGRVAALLDAPAEITDADAQPGPPLRGAIELRSLTFAYDDGTPVLRDVSLVVPAGSTVALVGPTGSGKSTLVSLLPRLHEAPPHTVFVDGRDVRTIPLAALRGAIGFVPQETFLFSDTLRGNVALGLPEAADPRVDTAAEVAQLTKDLPALPRGWETVVGERGITLSGGQKQRTALARALATDPPIVVLDDALSAVDTHTEEEILRGLRRATAERTTFIVSHRVSTVRHADQIVVLRDGGIVERGTHDTLVAAGGFYADLFRRQQLAEEVARA